MSGRSGFAGLPPSKCLTAFCHLPPPVEAFETAKARRLSQPKGATGGGSELSARSAGNSETENGQEQGELRAAANKATMFQPEWPGEAGEVARRKP